MYHYKLNLPSHAGVVSCTDRTVVFSHTHSRRMRAIIEALTGSHFGLRHTELTINFMDEASTYPSTVKVIISFKTLIGLQSFSGKLTRRTNQVQNDVWKLHSRPLTQLILPCMLQVHNDTFVNLTSSHTTSYPQMSMNCSRSCL